MAKRIGNIVMLLSSRTGCPGMERAQLAIKELRQLQKELATLR